MALFSIEQIRAFAPDVAIFSLGVQTSREKSSWNLRGRSPQALWGELSGSPSPIRVQIDLETRECFCSCSSRKFPCEHILALTILDAYAELKESNAPLWVKIWLAERVKPQTEEKVKIPRSLKRLETEETTTAEIRAKRVAEGFAELKKFLCDLLRNGLGKLENTQETRRMFKERLDRLIDAEAPGAAAMIGECLRAFDSDEGWRECVLEQAGRLALLVEAYSKIDAAPEDFAREVRRTIGWSVELEEDPSSYERVKDRWFYLGSSSLSAFGSSSNKPVWLIGEQTKRFACLLNFADVRRALEPFLFDLSEPFEGALKFLPGVGEWRAICEKISRSAPSSSLKTSPLKLASTLSEFTTAISARLAKNPWLERVPAFLRDVVARPTKRVAESEFVVFDAQGQGLFVVADDPKQSEALWNIVAASYEEPIAVFGEWYKNKLTLCSARRRERAFLFLEIQPKRPERATLNSMFKQAFIGVRDDEAKIWPFLLRYATSSFSCVESQRGCDGKTAFDFESDKLAPMSYEEQETLTSCFDLFYNDKSNAFTQSFQTPSGLFNRCFERVVALDKRASSEGLYFFVKTIRAYRSILSPRLVSRVCGRLGYRFFKENSAALNFSVLPPRLFEAKPPKSLLTSAWKDRSDEDRVVVFKQAYRSAPKLAFELLRKDQDKLARKFVDLCFDSICDDVSEKDLEYLQNQKSPFGASPSLLNLLARIPSSNYAQETLKKAEKILTDRSSSAALFVRARLDERYCSPSQTSDALQTLGNVPLASWEEILSSSPENIYARFHWIRNGDVVLLAMLRSFALFGASDEWFEVCCDAFRELYELPVDSRNAIEQSVLAPDILGKFDLNVPFVRKALATGGLRRFERLLELWSEDVEAFGRRGEFTLNLLDVALQNCAYPWTEDFARAFCDATLEVASSLGRRDSRSRVRNLYYSALILSPLAVREDYGVLATTENDLFYPTKADVDAYLNACAWRERFDRLFRIP